MCYKIVSKFAAKNEKYGESGKYDTFIGGKQQSIKIVPKGYLDVEFRSLQTAIINIFKELTKTIKTVTLGVTINRHIEIIRTNWEVFS